MEQEPCLDRFGCPRENRNDHREGTSALSRDHRSGDPGQPRSWGGTSTGLVSKAGPSSGLAGRNPLGTEERRAFGITRATLQAAPECPDMAGMNGAACVAGAPQRIAGTR